MRKSIVWWSAVAVVFVCIFMFSSQSGPNSRAVSSRITAMLQSLWAGSADEHSDKDAADNSGGTPPLAKEKLPDNNSITTPPNNNSPNISPSVTAQNLTQEMSNTEAAVRKAAHFLVFFMLGLFVFLAISNNIRSGFVAVVATILTCLAVAVFDEIHQSFVDDRTSTVFDVGIDMCGVFIGVCAARLADRR